MIDRIGNDNTQEYDIGIGLVRTPTRNCDRRFCFLCSGFCRLGIEDREKKSRRVEFQPARGIVKMDDRTKWKRHLANQHDVVQYCTVFHLPTVTAIITGMKLA